ncbi:hypothetical protein E2542_SST26072 [Spatholobus suberectus]|nr:hypothetical protein E2542_SST26072 [Spatholobus suberectus]
MLRHLLVNQHSWKEPTHVTVKMGVLRVAMRNHTILAKTQMLLHQSSDSMSHHQCGRIRVSTAEINVAEHLGKRREEASSLVVFSILLCSVFD